MNFTPRTLGPERHFCEAVTMETIERVVPLTTIDAVVEAAGVREQRVRKLPTSLTILLLIGLGLYSHLSMAAVLQKLVKGWRLLWADWEYRVANASAITQRRYQLGARVLGLLFRRICQPLAQADTRGAFLFGRRLMAFDGTKEDVPDTPENARVFGRHRGPNGDSAYPKALTVLLSECGTHAVVDAEFAPCYASERDLGLRLKVCHFPPGTSKWNKIEHRLFSFISSNWRGEPLRDYETIVKLISRTATAKGLKVTCRLDRRKYPKGRKVTDEEMKHVNLERHKFHGDWNYTIRPGSS